MVTMKNNNNKNNNSNINSKCCCCCCFRTTIERKEQLSRRGLVIFSILTIFFFSGAFYGWGPMQLMLEENGNYNSKCNNNDDDNNEICSEQTAALLNVRLVSELTVLSAPVLGAYSDSKGVRNIVYLTTVTTLIGIILLVISTSYNNIDWLLYISFASLGIASTGGGILTVETGLVYKESNKTRSRVISALNTLYDAGAIVYLGLWAIYNAIQDINNSNAIVVVITGYLILAVFVFGGLCYFWIIVVPEQQDDDSIVDNPTTTTEITDTTQRIDTYEVGEVSTDGENNGLVIEDTNMQYNKETLNGNTYEADDVYYNNNDSSTYVIIAERSTIEQIKSMPFVCLCIFFAIHMSSVSWTIITARDFLKYLGDDEYNNIYLTIFTLLAPISVLALPLEDIVLHKFGYYPALQTVNILSLIHGTIKVITENLNIQVFGFVIASFVRCFLFAVTLSCLPTIVNTALTGRAVGVFIFSGGIVSFINIPLADIAVKHFSGNFFWPNLLYLLVNIPLLFLTWRIGKGLQREALAKEERKKNNNASRLQD